MKRVCATHGCTALTSTAAHCPQHQGAKDRRNNERLHAKQNAAGRDTAHWRRTREHRLIIDEYRCAYCHTPHDLTVHLAPALNGDHSLATIENTLTLCRSCHGKTDGARSAASKRTDAA